MNNKKGISTIVATVLIVLITVAAVTILWSAISPLIDRNLSEGTACFDVQNKLKIDTNKQYTCYNGTGVYYRVERAANSGSLEGFDVIVEADGETNRIISVTDMTALTENGAKTYQNATGLSGADVKYSIAPKVLIDGEKKACEASTPVEVSVCA